MPNNISIQELLDKALEKKEERIRSHKYSPSSFGRCFRNQYWNRKDEPPSNPPDKRTQRIFRAGHLFHDFVQSAILTHYPEARKEVLIENDNYKGYADLVINDEVIDIKSQHSKAFWYRKGVEWKDLEPKLYSNILQVMWYAIKLEKSRARLVFVSKDDLCINEYGMEVNDKWRKEVDGELFILNTFWQEQELPLAIPRAYPDKDGKPSECKWCQFLDKCNKIEGIFTNNKKEE